MNKIPSPIEDTQETKAAATPAARLSEARWVLVVVSIVSAIAVAFFSVPFWPAAAGFAVIVATTAFAPRRPGSRRLKLKTHRDVRRMWPGTGMKVTVDALPTPCFVADGRGITRYVNKQAQKVYGDVKPGEPLSFSLRAPSLLEAFDRVCASGQPEQIKWIEKVPSETWYEAHIAPMFMPGSGTEGQGGRRPDFILVVIQDLTENRRLERMRTDFVANASHELRTPLASLTGFIETIQGAARNDPAARDKFLSIMLEQAERMRRLIDDILSLSRIELKAHVRPTDTVDLIEIIRHTADALSPLAADMKVEIRLQLPDGPARMKGDRDELIQVTENLVENALKYGKDGNRVDINLLEENEDQEARYWQIFVRDYGEGISPEHLPRLTERFYRVSEDSRQVMKGTGLGLAIVKHILTRHQGRLDIKSEPGKGATFKVTFPAADKTEA
ncbi:Alkaline phosphatase synthesis sensor protein PhoR [Roseibium album]|nr:Alkaline phosphatase synthesis sensor protein PhoR [Roseibium album]